MDDENLLTQGYSQPYSQTSRVFASEQKIISIFTFNFTKLFINILVPQKSELEIDRCTQFAYLIKA